MSDTQAELETLRREIAELKAAQEQRQDDGDSIRGLNRLLREDLAKDENKAANLGILRSAVLTNRNGGNSVSSSATVYGHADKLPSADAFVSFITALAAQPLGLRAIHTLLVGHFEGKPLQQTKAELAQTLGVSEPEIEHALLPLVGNDSVRWGKNAQAEEYYVLNRHDLAVLISFAG